MPHAGGEIRPESYLGGNVPPGNGMGFGRCLGGVRRRKGRREVGPRCVGCAASAIDGAVKLTTHNGNQYIVDTKTSSCHGCRRRCADYAMDMKMEG